MELGILGKEFVDLFGDQLSEEHKLQISQESEAYERQQAIRDKMALSLRDNFTFKEIVGLHNKACDGFLKGYFCAYVFDFDKAEVEGYFSETLADMEECIEKGEVNLNDDYFVIRSHDGLNNGLYTFSSLYDKHSPVDLGRLVDYINVYSLHSEFGLDSFVSDIVLTEELLRASIGSLLQDTLNSEASNDTHALVTAVALVDLRGSESIREALERVRKESEAALKERDRLKRERQYRTSWRNISGLSEPEEEGEGEAGKEEFKPALEENPRLGLDVTFQVRFEQPPPLIENYITERFSPESSPELTLRFCVRFLDILVDEQDNISVNTLVTSIKGLDISWFQKECDGGEADNHLSGLELRILSDCSKRIFENSDETGMLKLFKKALSEL